MLAKYYLGNKGHVKMSPPSLEGTRLHFVGELEFGKLSERLLNVHRYTDNISRIQINCPSSSETIVR